MSKPAKKSDWEIQQDVERQLAWSTPLAPTEIGVEVARGIVTLTGTVESWSAARAAEDAAHHAAGVLDVANELEVRDTWEPGRSDTDIARAVRQALEWDAEVPAARILSTVSHGVVTLEGCVTRLKQRLHAERAVTNLMGVTRVINRIEV